MSTAGPSEHSSGDRHRRLRLAVHLLLGLLTVALGVWAGLRWSLIAVGVDSSVASTAWAEEGPDFKLLAMDNDQVLTIDDTMMDRMGGPEAVLGKRFHTNLLGTTLTIGDRQIDLRWSSTASRTTLLLGAVVLLGILRTLWLRGHPPSPMEPRG